MVNQPGWWADWLCLDIETTAGRPESAEAWMRAQWSPSPQWTPETIGKRFKEAHEKKLQKLALLDAAGIAVVALRGPGLLKVSSFGFGVSQNETTIVHCLAEQPLFNSDFALTKGFSSEHAMLYLDASSEMWIDDLGECLSERLKEEHSNRRADELPRCKSDAVSILADPSSRLCTGPKFGCVHHIVRKT